MITVYTLAVIEYATVYFVFFYVFDLSAYEPNEWIEPHQTCQYFDYEYIDVMAVPYMPQFMVYDHFKPFERDVIAYEYSLAE